jgi:hypothetical protein
MRKEGLGDAFEKIKFDLKYGIKLVFKSKRMLYLLFRL